MTKYYLKFNLVIVCALFLSIAAFAQKTEALWSKTTKTDVFSKNPLYQQIEPAVVSYYQLNLEGLKNSLRGVPQRGTSNSNFIMQFPNVDGQMESFRIEEASNFAPELQAQFPDTRSYIGHGITNPRAILRFSISPEKGLSSMVLSDKKTVFVEPYSEDLSTYRVYIRTAEDIKDSEFICQTESMVQSKEFDEALTNAARNANDGKLRTFRLALACTGEYATFHGGTIAGVVAAMNTTMTRVNGVFERDVAIRMVIVATNTNVIFLNGATDPYTNNNGGAMLNQNQTTCNNNIGVANYDIGHVFSTGGGGIAQLNSPCGSGKARGVTGLGSPIGDFFDIDYVAHEMGHQYGGNHTQNNNCQRSSQSFEPGSASTIMGYAGICAPNVQNNSDDYFHGASIREMWLNISAGTSQCAAQSETNNPAPVAIAGADFSIPISTPFILKGAATDANSTGSLSYCWEQLDATPATMPPVSTSTVGPAFRSNSPVPSPDRYMPAYATVLSGSTSSTWEVVPSVGRSMNFNLTVRDNFAGGAGTSSDGMVVNTVSAGGAFTIASLPSWGQGTSQTVTWNVGVSNVAPINCQIVNIKFSTDGGLTFPTTLAANTANDGSESITVPSIADTSNARLLIEAVDNIFYNVSNIFSVSSAPDFAFSASNANLSGGCGNDAVTYNFSYTVVNGFSETTTFSATGNPAGTTVTFTPQSLSATGTYTMQVSNLNASTDGNYTITVTGTSTSITKTATVALNISNSLCASVANTQYETSTTGVAFGTINNQNTGKPSGYSDYTAISTDVNRESSYPMTIKVNTDGNFLCRTTVWIDWNQNCSFADAGETYDLGTAQNVTNGNTSLSPLSITIPAGAALGATLMRVSTKYSSAPTACENGADAEVEDYTVNVLVPLSVAEFDASNFSIFPNPNQGEFTIKLKSSSNSNIKVEVYDVRGRSIFNSVYSNTSEFNQTINLKSVQSGMYLVKVSDGEKQTTKKIIVE
jgi:hypothetical protein